MTRFRNRLFAVALAAFFCLGLDMNAAQASQDPAQTSPSAVAASAPKPHGPMPAELTKSLDSKKLKAGDPVMASITVDLRLGNGQMIPRGSKMTGQVTEAKARSKGDPQATLGIAFDKITTPDGKDLAIKGVLQAVGPNPHPSAMPADSPAGPGLGGNAGGKSGGTTPPPTSMPNPGQGPQPSGPILNGQSKGVVGIHNLELGDNSVLTSSGKEVKLDSGTQMIVQVEFE